MYFFRESNNDENGEEDIQRHVEDTKEHKVKVKSLILDLVAQLRDRAVHHDDSKLIEPEKSGFGLVGRKLNELEYGTQEYDDNRNRLKPILEEHYKKNRHHPEHHDNGVGDMNLIDVVEMVCDWYASYQRTKDGDIYESLEVNQDRFGFSDDLKNILKNTIDKLNKRG